MTVLVAARATAELSASRRGKPADASGYWSADEFT
jgi:hypothetical protein